MFKSLILSGRIVSILKLAFVFSTLRFIAGFE